MRIITWNVNSINIRLERLLGVLDRWNPDIVCLQELKCIDEKFPREAIRAAGYESIVFGQKTYNGVALLSKKMPITIQKGFNDGDEDTAARFIMATFSNNFHVASLYVPNGQAVGTDKFAYKLRWLERLRNIIEDSTLHLSNLVLAGDFNIAPSDLDVHDPKMWEGAILCSHAERSALERLCELGFKDAYRLLHERETQFTWWDYRNLSFPKNLGLRIDLFLISEALKKSPNKCFVDRDERKNDRPSDHAPVILDLDF